MKLLAQRHSPLRPVVRGDVDSVNKAWQETAAGKRAANGMAGDPAAGLKTAPAAARAGSSWLAPPEEVRPGGWHYPRRLAVEAEDADQVRIAIHRNCCIVWLMPSVGLSDWPDTVSGRGKS